MDAYRLERSGGGGPGTVYRPDGTELDPDRSREIIDKSPNGFQWSYRGSGPHQLGLALLLDVTDDADLAQRHYHRFTVEVISKIEQDQCELPVAAIMEWLEGQSN